MKTHPAWRNRTVVCAVAVLCLWDWSAAASAEAGKLSSARSAVRSGGSSSSSSRSSGSRSSSSSAPTSSWGGSVHPGWYGFDPLYDNWLTWMLFPWWGPRRWMDDNGERAVAFSTAPYADGYDGYMRIEGRSNPQALAGVADKDETGAPLLGRGSALRMWAEGGVQDSHLFRGGAGFLWSGFHRLELQGDVRVYGEREAGRTDTLLLGTVAVNYLFALAPGVQVRSGAGLRWLPDGDQTHVGALFSYGADFYPASPLVISVAGDVGAMNDAVNGTLRGTLGAVFDQLEVYGGYEALWVEDIDLGMWVFGARLWL